MQLLDRMLGAHVQRGELTIIDHKGNSHRYGSPDPELAPVTVRFRDAKVPLDIARDPALGTAETWMDDRLVLEQGEIIDLVRLIRRNRRWEERTSAQKFLKKTKKW